MRNRWPTKDEIELARELEFRRACDADDHEDPICECGEPGWACRCKALMAATGTYADGTPLEGVDRENRR